MNRLLPSLSILAAAAVSPLAADFEGAFRGTASTGCARDSLGSAVLIRNLQTIVTGTTYPYTEIRDSLQIPAVAPEQVTLVTDPTLCAKVAAIYDRILVARGDDPNPRREVIVVRVGDRYAVQDPLETAGEFRVTIMLDSAHRYLSIW